MIQFFSTSPIIDSFDSLNKQLEEQLKTDRKRTHYSKHQLIEDFWKKENKVIHSLTEEDYPIFKEVEAKLNRYHEIKFDQTIIHIPKAYGYSQLTVAFTWNIFKVLTPYGEL
ncbi:hypothetical protein [Enterococcus sp. OL5]|uniref:hypothetical protein n=1 Tax=Enterococcus sp. OL5 TaxID=2590214 RepID=UPI001CB8D01E|nr:hypothetical protein [Enterococcus sp. OL5]